MNIFKELHKIIAQNKREKLMYDAEGRTFLYNSYNNSLKRITIVAFKDFTSRTNDFGRIEPLKNPEANSSCDKVLIYSVKVGEKTIGGIVKPIVKYGFIGEDGYAITHASYDNVGAFENGLARVYIDKKCCIINLSGNPIVNGKVFNNAEFVTQFVYSGFAICCTDGKYGLINKYFYQCLPCEYDGINYKKTYDYDFFEVRRNDVIYTAFIDGGTICNIVNIIPKTIREVYNFLLIEEVSHKDGKSVYGLLNRGGVEILKSEYDNIDIVHDYVCIVSKGNFKQLLFVAQTGYEIEIDKCSDIHFGIGFNDKQSCKYLYAIYNEKCMQFLNIEDDKGNHVADGYVFSVENYEEIGCEYDRIYFTHNEDFNNYLAVVVGDKTEVVDLFGDVIIPLVIPSCYKIMTDKFSEGIFGIEAKVQEERDSDGVVYEKEYYSYINSEGKILTDFIYDGIGKFKDGKAEAYYYASSKTTYHVIDKNGNVISEYSDYTDYQNDGIWGNYINEWRDDAFEGDADAYWNVD